MMNVEKGTKDKNLICQCQVCQVEGKKITDAEILQKGFTIKKIHKLIELKFEELLKDLEVFMAIRSVSKRFETLGETVKVMDLMAAKLEKLHFDVMEFLVNPHFPNHKDAPQQKVLFANFFSSPAKCTLLIYAHLDVFPAEQKAGWYHDPFELLNSEGILCGRGMNFGKGPAVCWLNAIQVWMDEENDLPINIKFVVECMQEMHSEGLEEHIKSHPDFFADVDYMVFSVNSWLNRDTPVISCSLCGWVNIGVELRGGNKTVDSGSVGGMVYEPMTDICRLMNSLVDNQQTVLVPLLDQGIRPLNAHEWELLEAAEFSDYDYMDRMNVRRLRHQLSKAVLLHKRFCNPSLCMHGVEGCYIESGSELSTPLEVTGKLSIKLVPDQSAQSVFKTVKNYLKLKYDVLNMHTDMEVNLLDSADPIRWDFDSIEGKVMKKAVTTAYKVNPVVTQNIGICLKVATQMYNLIGKKIILLPWSKRPENRHPPNESISEKCYMTNIQMCASLMHELSLLPPKCKCNLIKGYCDIRSMTEYKQMKSLEDRLQALQKVPKSINNVIKSKPKRPKKKIRKYVSRKGSIQSIRKSSINSSNSKTKTGSKTSQDYK